jgi:uncharacterized protein (DUF2336 family)
MSLNFLDKSSSVTPLLVRLYDSQRLDGLASDKGAGAKAELISAISELLEMELSPRESELVADVMIGLLAQAELDMRQALADKLAALDNVPLRLILQMASDDISVADSILRRSKILSDLDLIYIIKSQGEDYWQSIAQRESINDPVMNILVDTADMDTAIKLAENQKITLNEYALSALSDMAQGSEKLARPLLRREEVPDTVAQKLFQFVGAELKAYIKSEYGIEQGSIAEAVDEILLDFIDSAQPQHEFSPSSAMLKDAMRQKQKGLLTTRLMLASLRRGQIMPFVAQFSSFTGLDVSSVLEILGQSSGQGLATSCKAYDISKEDFVSIYLLTNRIRNKGSMVELTDMSRATRYYEKMSKDIALDIIKNSQVDS